MTPVEIEITVLAKDDGPLTKSISLNDDGSIKSDGSACRMTEGTARRVRFTEIQQYADLIVALKPNQAIATGAPRSDLPDLVKVTTKRKLNGSTDLIARTQQFIAYRPGQPALAPIDFDIKGMPVAVADKMTACGGLWDALVSVCQPLATAARVERASTSAGLFHALTGEPFDGNGGKHIYIVVKDGADVERFLKTLHARCCLAGLGWMMVGKAGQLLERSIVDRVCGSPERLMFEAPPILIDPVAQDRAARQPVVVNGAPLDTLPACPSLTIVERARLQEFCAKEAQRLAGECAGAREIFIARQASRLAERTGMDMPRARRTVERECDGVLLPDVELLFDDPQLEGKTVADVLAAPDRFEEETLADPLEGIEYGRCKAKVMRNPDGSMWIHSFAHGGGAYALKRDFCAVEAALQDTPKHELVDRFVQLVLIADLRDDEIERLKQRTAAATGVGVRTLAASLKAARQRQAAAQAQQKRQRRLAERLDPRQQLSAPVCDGEFLPVMGILNDVIGASPAAEPPTRNPNKVVAMAREIRVPSLHALTSMETNLDGDPHQPAAGSRAADPEAAQ
jgi:hypothetical protein